MTGSDTAAFITAAVQDYWAGPDNRLDDAREERAWDKPIVGFARGDDPIFEQFKEVVDPDHWTPLHAFAVAYPNTDARADELTVISWVLPQTRATKRDHRKETFYPAMRWARSRTRGEEFNLRMRTHLVRALAEAGMEAAAPGLLPGYSSKTGGPWVKTSNWSERHMAYAAGLGTFGLSDGLITPVGKAMRVGSVVARVQIPPTPRPYTNHHAYCPFYGDGSCGQCIVRCPAGAITAAGHDKLLCDAYCGKMHAYVESTFGFKGYGCGLCQVGVPCESGIPKGIAVRE
jgi:epoxyqueuosine reductase QueG